MGKKKTRKRYSADFKAKVALEAIRGDLTLAELAAKHGVHHTMIAAWKRQAIDGMAGTFSGAGDAAKAASEGLSLLEYLGIVRQTLMTQMLAAAAVNDRNATANLAGKALDVLRETGKLTGELLESARTIHNVSITNNSAVLLASPAFTQLEAMLMRRLAPYPDAMREVVAGLLEMQPAPDARALPAAEGFHATAA